MRLRPLLRLSTLSLLLFTAGVSIGERDAFADAPSAADKDTARKLMGDGNDAFAAKDYKKALEAFSGAHALMNLPTTGLGVMRSQERLGLLVEARDTALAIIRIPPRPSEPKPEEAAREEAGQLAEALASRIPTLLVTVSGIEEGRDYALFVDDVEVPAASAKLPRKANPGGHDVVVRAKGYFDARGQISLVEGAPATLPLELRRDPHAKPDAAPIAPPPKKKPAPLAPIAKSDSSIHPLVWVGVATAGAGVVVGTATGVAVLTSKGDCKTSLTKKCPIALANVSNVGFAVAGAGAILGVVGLVLTATHGSTPSKKAAFIEPELGPGYLGVKGAF